MDPVTLGSFEHAGVRYNLRKPVPIHEEFTDGLWVLHNEALNLWGHGEHREDALHELQENFAYLWKELAEEGDEVLDEKAKAIKQALLDIRVFDTAVTGA